MQSVRYGPDVQQEVCVQQLYQSCPLLTLPSPPLCSRSSAVGKFKVRDQITCTECMRVMHARRCSGITTCRGPGKNSSQSAKLAGAPKPLCLSVCQQKV